MSVWRCQTAFLSLFLLLKVADAAAGEARLAVTPQLIQPGQEVSLTWQVEDQRAYLSGIGAVGLLGTIKVAPRETTTYSLVTDGPNGSIKSITVTVSGGKGESEFPWDMDRFRFPLTSRRTVSSLVAFLDGVHRVLQDEMKFSLRESSPDSGRVIFLTHSSERADLLQNGEDGVASRRISYLLEVKKATASDTLNVSIKALIEYRRRRESTWRQETDAALYQRATARLRERIELLR